MWVSVWVATGIPEISNLVSKEFINIECWLRNIEANPVVQVSVKRMYLIAASILLLFILQNLINLI